MNKLHRFMQFFAPEGDAAGSVATIEAPGVTVPEIAPAGGGHEVQEVNIPGSGIEDTVEFGVKGPKDLFGEDPELLLHEQDEKMGKEGRERGADGKFLPKKKEEGAPEPKAEKPAKPVKEPAKPATEPPKKPTETPAAKVKIGDTENTAEEWAAELRELREKVEKATLPPKLEEKKPEDAKDPEAEKKAAEEEEKVISERRKAFIDRELARQDDIDEKALDTMLAGGPEAVARFREIRAKDKLEVREWASRWVNKVRDEFKTELQPLLEHQQRIAEFTEEQNALTAFPELQTNPKGLETYRKIKSDFSQSYQSIQQRMASNEASPQERAWALIYENQTPEALRESIAAHAKAELAKTAPVAAKPVATPVRPVIRPTKPINGDRPGGVSTPKTESKDAAVIRGLQEAGKWD